MIKVIVNLNFSIKRVALVSLSLYGVFLAQPKVISVHDKFIKHRCRQQTAATWTRK
jgi:hypothetical protein